MEVDMKLMCLNCGRYFSMEYPIVSFQTVCPYCKDSYFVDNVVPGIPPDISEAVKVDLPCGHSIVSDMVKDIVACPVCGVPASFTEGASLKEWQNNEIERRVGI
jgi:DNA-directed RNA polymerase subunit RPC12/RpoP